MLHQLIPLHTNPIHPHVKSIPHQLIPLHTNPIHPHVKSIPHQLIPLHTNLIHPHVTLIPHQLIPHLSMSIPHHQTHPQGNQVSSQQKHVSPSPPWQQDQMPSTSYQSQDLLSTYPTILPNHQDYQWPAQQAQVSLSPPLQQEAYASPSGPLYINQSPSYPMQDLITFDKGDTNLANASYEWPPPSNPMPTHEPTSPIPTPPCDPIPSPLIPLPSKPPSPPLPSSPCHSNPSPKDVAEIVLQRMLEAKIIELPDVKPCEENPYDEHDYCVYHRTKGHDTNKYPIFVPIFYKVYRYTIREQYISNLIIPPSNPNPNPTPSTLIIHPLYCPYTHTLMKDVIHWLLARNITPPCQTPILETIQESSINMPILTSPSCDPQTIKPIQELSTSIQATQEVCKEFNPKHVETLSPSPSQDQITFMQPIHNIYLFHDQDDIDNDEHIHDPLDLIHTPTTIHEKAIQIQTIHNMYLFHDQDDTYKEAIHEHLDPIHNPIIYEQDSKLILVIRHLALSIMSKLLLVIMRHVPPKKT